MTILRRSSTCRAAAFVGAVASSPGCAAEASPPRAAPAPRAGGDTTIVDRSSNAYGFPAPNLGPEDADRHADGDAAFEATFVAPPATVNAGLGPRFNNNACSKCHVRDGRGLPVAGTGPVGSALVVRIDPVGMPLGDQIQDHAVFGTTPEAEVGVEWVEVGGSFGDGEPYTLRRPILRVRMPDGSPLPGQVLTSARIPPPVFGLGLLEAVPESALRAQADPDDADGDGISGRANDIGPERTLGRFGWKASASDLLHQAADEYAADMGVTSPLAAERDGGVEIERERLEVTALYTRTLAVPRRERWDEDDVLRGEELFGSIGCASCHVATLYTGEHQVHALRGQQIHAYTDLLLHNMGFELADGRPELGASGTEWRTAPLWGVGLAQTVLPGACFLHDGRARTLEEAVLWHGGEGEASREAFRLLSRTQRSELIAFLESL